MEKFVVNSKTKLYIGDICYVLPDDVYYDLIEKANYKPGSYDIPGSDLKVAWVNTQFGDGVYSDNKGHNYYVDAGIIGLVPIELCTRGKYDDLNRLGQVIDYVGDASISVDRAGTITVELKDKKIEIYTGDAPYKFMEAKEPEDLKPEEEPFW